MATALEVLIASGIPAKMAERIVNQATAEATPKKTKAARKFFPGMNSAKAKVDMEIDVLVVCDCCGTTEAQKKTIKALPDSPKTMKVATQLCNKCPDMFRALTHEQLVSLALVRHHGGIMAQQTRDKGQIAMAKKLTPEEVVNHRTTTY
jgi:hypothetical protein